MSNDFKIVIPAEMTKAEDGSWKIKGVASTASRDHQGEVVLQRGIDATAIDNGKAFFNWDHKTGPENIVGTIDSYSKKNGDFIVEGRLFKKHKKAQAVQEIMSSLDKSDRGRMGMSVEGKILERTGKDGKTIKKCKITAVALTMNPVNQDSHAELMKSLTAEGTEIDFETKKVEDLDKEASKEAVFTASEVVEMVSKALSVGSAYATSTPGDLSGGDALAQEEFGDRPRCKKCKKGKKDCKCPNKSNPADVAMPYQMKKMDKGMYKSQMGQLLDSIQKLYPDYSRSLIWEALKDRLNRKFPEIYPES